MNIALWIAQALLAGMFAMAGVMKAFTPQKAQQQMAWAKDRSAPFLRFVGVAEMLGALGVVLPLLTGILPWLTPLAAAGLALIQFLAIATVHIPRKEYSVLPMNLLLLALALFVAVGRWGLMA